MNTTPQKRHSKRRRLRRFGLILAASILCAVLATTGASLLTRDSNQSGIGTSQASAQEPADINNDNAVDIYDLTLLLGKWNTTDSTADISKDGIVNVFDLSILLSKWGVVIGGIVYGPVDIQPPTSAYVTPEQYGAIGNGVADDTEAMQNALNAAEGKTLWLPANKRYQINRMISVGKNTTVKGAGKNSVLKFTWFDSSGSESGGGAYMQNKGINTSGDVNIHISNFVIEGAGSGEPSGSNASNPLGLTPSLRLRRIVGFSVKNMEIRNSPGISLTYAGNKNGDIRYNYVHHSGRDGITGFWGGTDAANLGYVLSDITVEYNYVTKVGDDGLAIVGVTSEPNASALPTRIMIRNNIIDGWDPDPNGLQLGRGIAIVGANDLTVDNNDVARTAGAGILLQGCEPYICPDGTIDPSTNLPWQSGNIRFTNNRISDPSSCYPGIRRCGGIYINNSFAVTVTGNTFVNANPPIKNEFCQNCSIQ